MPPPRHKKSARATELTVRARVLILAISFAVLASLVVAYLVVRFTLGKPETPHTSILDIPIEGAENTSNVSAAELLALADKQCETMLSTYPSLAAAYNLKANRDYLTGDMDVAAVSWNKALALDASSSEALFGLALIAFEASQFERAIELCEQSQLVSGGNPRIPLLLADSYLQDGQPDKAILVLLQHLASEPSSVQAVELLGTAYLNARDFENAVVQFKQALQFSPNSKDSQYGLAQAYSKLGRKEEAKIHLDKFNELSKEMGSEHRKDAQAFRDREFAAHVAAQVHADSATIYKQHSQYEKAVDSLLRAQRLQPDVPAWLEELQQCFFALGKLQEAADVGERLTKIDPKNLEYWLKLGQIYSDVQNADRAIASFEQAIALAPDDERCLRAQAVIGKSKSK
jgi:tetratricopeptide (TPR) repeat protein